MALADGVGGWSEEGIDPSLYSKELMHLMEIEFSSNIETYA